MSIQSVFAENMRKYRKKAKLTQEKLAEMCSTDFRYIGQIETGNRCPSLEYVERIAVALNVEPYLLFYEDKSKECNEDIDLSVKQKQKIKSMLFKNYAEICSLIDKK